MVHDVFHVSQLKQCFKQPEHAVVLRAVQLSADPPYPEHPIRVLVTSERETRNKLSSSRRCGGLIILRRGYIGVLRLFPFRVFRVNSGLDLGTRSCVGGGEL